jgi:hypothetical protein
MIESGIRKALGQNVDKVDDIPGFWNWLRFDTLVPELFDQTDVYGDVETNKTFWSRVLTFNQLQGPLVLEQSRSKKMPCASEIISGMICYPQKSASSSSFGRNVTVHVATPSPLEYAGGNVTLKQREASYASAFIPVAEHDMADGRRLRPLRTSFDRFLPKGPASDEDKFRVVIFPNTPRVLIDEHLSYLYEKGWIDEQTKEVSIKALLLNAEVGRPRLEQYQVSFRFSRGGGIFARMTLESIFLLFAAGNFNLFLDLLWVCCLIFSTLVEIRNVFRATRNKRCTRMFSQFWSLLQWTIIVVGWIIVMSYLYQNVLRIEVVRILKIVIANQKDDIPAEMDEVGNDLFQATDAMAWFSAWFRLILADYHLCLMFRFFSAFQAQPRLGVVTSTLEASVVDIAHFLVVLLPTFMAFSITGSFIFGRRMREFATFNEAIGICFKMIMEGEYDWNNLSKEHFWTAALWTWSFMLIMVMLMLNMVLAIVMDVYTMMHKRVGQSETVWASLKNLIARAYLWRKWVSTSQVLARLDTMDSFISREDLLTEFPGMTEHQLQRIMSDCYITTAAGTMLDTELGDTKTLMMSIKLAVDKFNEDVYQLGKEKDERQEAKNDTNYERKSVHPDKETWLHKVSKQMASQNHFMVQVQWMLQQLQWQWRVMEAVHGSDFKWGKVNIQSDPSSAESSSVEEL